MKIEIHQTKDFDKFKSITANREVSNSHVNKLIKAISRKNMLSICPIIVSGEFEVIDGQHRIEAAKKLDTPIYYIIGDDLDHADIISLNNVKIAWQLIDYINFYAIKKNVDYQNVTKIIAKNDHLKLGHVLAMISKDGKRRAGYAKAGKIDVTHLKNFDIINKNVCDYKQFLPLEYNSEKFILTIRKLTIKEGKPDFKYDHDLVIKKLTENKMYMNKLIMGEYSWKIWGPSYYWQAIKHIQLS